MSLPEATEKPMHGTPAHYVKTKFFAKLTTTPHYDGYRMVLVVLANVTKTELWDFVTESWRLRAPKKLVDAFDAEHQ